MRLGEINRDLNTLGEKGHERIAFSKKDGEFVPHTEKKPNWFSRIVSSLFTNKEKEKAKTVSAVIKFCTSHSDELDPVAGLKLLDRASRMSKNENELDQITKLFTVFQGNQAELEVEEDIRWLESNKNSDLEELENYSKKAEDEPEVKTVVEPSPKEKQYKSMLEYNLQTLPKSQIKVITKNGQEISISKRHLEKVPLFAEMLAKSTANIRLDTTLSPNALKALANYLQDPTTLFTDNDYDTLIELRRFLPSINYTELISSVDSVLKSRYDLDFLQSDVLKAQEAQKECVRRICEASGSSEATEAILNTMDTISDEAKESIFEHLVSATNANELELGLLFKIAARWNVHELETLDLSNVGIDVIDAQQLEFISNQFPNLKTLKIIGSVYDVIDEHIVVMSLQKLKNIECLSLKNFRILPGSALENLQLKELHLDGTQLKKYDILAKFPLEVLTLSSPETKVYPIIFKALEGKPIRSLHLINWNMREAKHALIGFPLETLHLTHCRPDGETGIQPGALQLKELIISRGFINIATLKNMPLKKLKLDHAIIDESNVDQLLNLPLEEVHLIESRFGRVDTVIGGYITDYLEGNIFSVLPDLKKLVYKGTSFSERKLNELNNIIEVLEGKSIEELDFTNAPFISDRSLPVLLGLPLRSFNFTGTGLTQDALNRLTLHVRQNQM